MVKTEWETSTSSPSYSPIKVDHSPSDISHKITSSRRPGHLFFNKSSLTNQGKHDKALEHGRSGLAIPLA